MEGFGGCKTSQKELLTVWRPLPLGVGTVIIDCPLGQKLPLFIREQAMLLEPFHVTRAALSMCEMIRQLQMGDLGVVDETQKSRSILLSSGVSAPRRS